jgi:hypothetical protein
VEAVDSLPTQTATPILGALLQSDGRPIYLIFWGFEELRVAAGFICAQKELAEGEVARALQNPKEFAYEDGRSCASVLGIAY